MGIDADSLVRTYAEVDSEELLRLHGSGTLTPLAYEVLERTLVERGIPLPARPLAPAFTTAPNPILEYWNGNRPFALAFWLVGVTGSVGACVLALALSAPLQQLLGRSGGVLVVLAIVAIYLTFACVAIWRCSANHPWRYMARLVALLAVTFIAYSIVGLLVLGVWLAIALRMLYLHFANRKGLERAP